MLPSHDFKRRLCPFCKMELDIMYEYTATEYRCLDCKVGSYTRYTLTYDIFKEMYAVSIVLNKDTEVYAVSIRYDRVRTWLERIDTFKDHQGDFYYAPTTVLLVDVAFPFNLEDPIQSGNEIMNRLLTLRAFS